MLIIKEITLYKRSKKINIFVKHTNDLTNGTEQIESCVYRAKALDVDARELLVSPK